MRADNAGQLQMLTQIDRVSYSHSLNVLQARAKASASYQRSMSRPRKWSRRCPSWRRPSPTPSTLPEASEEPPEAWEQPLEEKGLKMRNRGRFHKRFIATWSGGAR